MHQEGPGLCHYCSSFGLAGVWESGVFLVFHTSKGNSTDRTFFVFNKDYVASGFSCWGCIINMGLARNSEWAFIENHIPNFSLWLQRSLPWSRKSNISEYPEKIVFHWLTEFADWLPAQHTVPKPTEAMGDSTMQAPGDGEEQCPFVWWRGSGHARQTVLGKHGNEIQQHWEHPHVLWASSAPLE